MGIIYVVYLLGIITKRGEKQKDIAMFERVGRRSYISLNGKSDAYTYIEERIAKVGSSLN